MSRRRTAPPSPTSGDDDDDHDSTSKGVDLGDHDDASSHAASQPRDGTEVVGDPSDPDILRILISTDNHVGFAERDQIRGQDSFLAFEEVLQTGLQQQVRHLRLNLPRFFPPTVDFVLLGGDLFHENHPSRVTVVRTIEMLRKYTLGDGAVAFKVLSDPVRTFTTSFGCVNYEDPNFNIQMPIFSVHGNHDDPTRETHKHKSYAALDILSEANLINYFGKVDDLANVVLYPVLIEKGITKLALYGLGAIRDERLYHLFESGKVTFARPTQTPQEWFNIFVIHQNHVAGRGAKNHIPEKMLPDFLDLVVWGHEHECLIDPARSTDGKRFFVTQPGSSVATSLIEGEAVPKCIGVLELRKDQFKLTPIRLRNVRPFILGDICMDDHPELDKDDPGVTAELTKLFAAKVESMIAEAQNDPRHASLPAELELPLIRLRIDLCGFPTLNNQRFGAQFVDRVANPADLLLFKRRRVTVSRSGGPVQIGSLPSTAMDTREVEDLVLEQLQAGGSRLNILVEQQVAGALHEYAAKHNLEAMTNLISESVERTQKAVRTSLDKSSVSAIKDVALKHTADLRLTMGVDWHDEDNEENLDTIIARAQAASSGDEEADGDGDGKPKARKRKTPAATAAKKPAARKAAIPSDDDDDNDDDDDDGGVVETKAAGRGRGRGRGRASAAAAGVGTTARGRGRGRGRGSKAAAAPILDSDSDAADDIIDVEDDDDDGAGDPFGGALSHLGKPAAGAAAAAAKPPVAPPASKPRQARIDDLLGGLGGSSSRGSAAGPPSSAGIAAAPAPAPVKRRSAQIDTTSAAGAAAASRAKRAKKATTVASAADSLYDSDDIESSDGGGPGTVGSSVLLQTQTKVAKRRTRNP